MYSALVLLCTLDFECYYIAHENLFDTYDSCEQAIYDFVMSDYFEPMYLRFDEDTLYYLTGTKCISWFDNV